MIGALAGAAIGAVGSIFGGLTASNAARKAKREVEGLQQENETWYNRRYNEDVTQRADALRLLRMTEDSLKSRNQAAAGTAAVMGSSTESVAATQSKNNEVLGETMARIHAQGEARKDGIDQQYRARKAALSEEMRAIEQNRASNIANAAMGLSQAAGEIGVATEGFLDKKK